jgi:hypothetical protein
MTTPLVLLITLSECAKVNCTSNLVPASTKELSGIARGSLWHTKGKVLRRKALKYLCIPGEVLNPKEVPIGTAPVNILGELLARQSGNCRDHTSVAGLQEAYNDLVGQWSKSNHNNSRTHRRKAKHMQK